MTPFAPCPRLTPKAAAPWLLLAAVLAMLGACAETPQTAGPHAPTAMPGGAHTGEPISEGQDIATQHAVFKVSRFEALPGWQQDNFTEVWAAFRESCKALARKPGWKARCAQLSEIRDPQAGRLWLEREFTLLTVQNDDRSREGDITGYYEPLLNGQPRRVGAFTVPVHGVPNDLYTLDWKSVPAAQRKTLAWVRANGRVLRPAQAAEPGAIAIDLRRFTLDTLDRRLRVRLQGKEALPYYSRAEIQQLPALDAPVLAWVDDPLALYAMQVQGTGRIRLPDGRILRLQYAEQNGQPFRPLRLASAGNERVQTRGESAGSADEAEQFELVDGGEASADEPMGEPLTRSLSVRPSSPVLGNPAPVASAPAPKPGVNGGDTSSQIVADLLGQARRTPPASKGSGPVGKGPTQVAIKAPTLTPTVPAVSGPRNQALVSDPSYVFFRIATDQSPQSGPVGALGVPLTAGRSLAVDPRVLPLGYPVFLDAASGDRRRPGMQRLMFAQDTGGAIRGAVRADYFWGFGADAGRQARQTRHKGRIWVLVPHAEVQALLSSRLVTRGASLPAAQPVCLVNDPDYCDSDPAD